MIKHEIIKIASEINKDKIVLSEFQKIRENVINYMLNQFFKYAGDLTKPMIIINAFKKINTEWIEAVKELHEKGYNLYKLNGFKLVMRETIKQKPELKVLETYIN